VWCASQFHRPDEEDGIVMLFRRAGSPYETAKYTLYRIDPTADYLFTEADGGEMQLSGRELTQQGFCITLPEKRSSKVYFYKKL
jgi:alpha-galactosidase